MVWALLLRSACHALLNPVGGAQHGWRCQQLLVACAWQVMGPAWSFFAFLLGDRCITMASRHSTTAQQLAGLRWLMWRMSSRMCWECLCWPHVGVVCAGDSTSAVMAPPYSTTVTTNLWAVYCNRYGPAVVTAQHSGCAVHCHGWYRLLEGGKAALQALQHEVFRCDDHSCVCPASTAVLAESAPSPASTALASAQRTCRNFCYCCHTVSVCHHAGPRTCARFSPTLLWSCHQRMRSPT